jgi:phenylacetate-CoA ligase
MYPLQKRFDDAGLKPDDIRSVDDLNKLPFTVKQDLDNYPFAVRGSNGEMYDPRFLWYDGKANRFGYTKNDIKIWGGYGATLGAGGVTKKGYRSYQLRLTVFYGRLGRTYGSKHRCATIPRQPQIPCVRSRFCRDFNRTFLCALLHMH